MRNIILTIILLTTFADAQGTLPWGQATSIPLLAKESGVTLFYVASYNPYGSHTSYDMARQAADAYLARNPTTPTYLVLNPAPTSTCDTVPLPSVARGDGTLATLSIIGYGSNVSTIARRAGCNPVNGTLSHLDAVSGPVTNALYQGFMVDANHIDLAACGFYGMSTSTFFDVACGNAAPGTDHEVEFGNLDPKAIGQDYGISIYNLKSFDGVGVGKSANLKPVWTGNALTGVTVVNAGSKKYTQQYIRAQIVGPDLASCTKVPTLSPIVSNMASGSFPNLPPVTYGWVMGATITNPGSCSSTARLYILIQDGVSAMYGMKFSNIIMSHAWNLESTGSSVYGEAWMPDSGNNTIIGEHPYTNQTIQIAEYAGANKHINTLFDSPGMYGAAIYGPSGSFMNPVFSWDSDSYPSSSGYYFGAAADTYHNWSILNSQCTNGIANFISITTTSGFLSTTNLAPKGLSVHDIERCDWTTVVDWATPVSSQ